MTRQLSEIGTAPGEVATAAKALNSRPSVLHEVGLDRRLADI